MPKFTLGNSFRFGSKREIVSNFYSENIETILKKLTKDWLGQFARDAQIQADLIGWKKMMAKINKVLDDAIEKQTKEESVKIWLGKLQHLACDVDFLLDEFQTEAFQRMLLQDGVDDAVDKSEDSTAMSKVKEVNARLQDIAWQINVLAAVRGGGQNRGPTIFSPLIEKEDLAFLEKEDCSASLEKIRSRASGEIYIAELPESNGKMIAIKKVKQVDNSLLNIKMRQVRAEIMTAGQIRHRNIVPLLAHMVRPDCHLLVSEFMKNGSLLEILNDVSQGRRELEWLARHRIARGIVSGLEYLHMYHRPRIIHRNITPSSVLIDDDMEARIADFGLARLMPDGHAQVSTSIVAGTVGYIAPEYHQTLKFSEKCDIYSFGVLLAVLVMGKLPSDDFFQHTEEKSLVRWMRNVMTSENPNRAIDSKLLGNGYEEQMLLVLKIACFCTLDDPEERPNSKDVRSMLSDTALIKDVDFLKMHKRMDFDNDDCDELIQQEIYTEWLSSLDSYNPL
ncbi:leucine-rich repeat receptor-like serine/threonine/tyrosine-protein kinase SOBIR1 [Citrus sinensis]|nr:leucine-rich repeat receptor-like serine/threonine/tyrosine-protein kinase SOBIR1 [Citrus sinensis]